MRYGIPEGYEVWQMGLNATGDSGRRNIIALRLYLHLLPCRPEGWVPVAVLLVHNLRRTILHGLVEIALQRTSPTLVMCLVRTGLGDLGLHHPTFSNNTIHASP
jgi:hypothetical protein